jgi:hypothetical protein
MREQSVKKPLGEVDEGRHVGVDAAKRATRGLHETKQKAAVCADRAVTPHSRRVGTSYLGIEHIATEAGRGETEIVAGGNGVSAGCA